MRLSFQILSTHNLSSNNAYNFTSQQSSIRVSNIFTSRYIKSAQHTLLSTALAEVLVLQIPKEELLSDIEVKLFIEYLHGTNMEVLDCANLPNLLIRPVLSSRSLIDKASSF